MMVSEVHLSTGHEVPSDGEGPFRPSDYGGANQTLPSEPAPPWHIQQTGSGYVSALAGHAGQSQPQAHAYQIGYAMPNIQPT